MRDWSLDEFQPPGITHLHLDALPSIGGDTYWASGYSAFDKLSPSFRKLIEGLQANYRSAHSYPNPDDPEGPRIPIVRQHPLVRVNAATGWKSLVSRYLQWKSHII
jgi:alpha-ketoglutarate-dependent taurine dioxygenase